MSRSSASSSTLSFLWALAELTSKKVRTTRRREANTTSTSLRIGSKAWGSSWSLWPWAGGCLWLSVTRTSEYAGCTYTTKWSTRRWSGVYLATMVTCRCKFWSRTTSSTFVCCTSIFGRVAQAWWWCTASRQLWMSSTMGKRSPFSTSLSSCQEQCGWLWIISPAISWSHKLVCCMWMQRWCANRMSRFLATLKRVSSQLTEKLAKSCSQTSRRSGWTSTWIKRWSWTIKLNTTETSASLTARRSSSPWWTRRFWMTRQPTPSKSLTTSRILTSTIR